MLFRISTAAPTFPCAAAEADDDDDKEEEDDDDGADVTDEPEHAGSFSSCSEYTVSVWPFKSSSRSGHSEPCVPNSL